MWEIGTEETFATKGIVVVLFALALSAAVGLMVRRRAPIWALTALLFLPVAVLFSLPDWRMFSWHGWLHFSIVYDLFERGVPPSFPFLAGYDLSYPYAFHLVVAHLMKVIPLAPSWYFAALALACLLGTIVAIDRLASMISTDRGFRLLSITLAMFGFGTLLATPVGQILAIQFGFPFENRLDPLHKFMEVGVYPIGLLFFTIALLGLAHIVDNERAWPRGYILFACGFIGSGLFYPHAWLAAGLAAGAACVQLWLINRPKQLKSAIVLGALTAGASLLILPWLLAISAGRSRTASFQPIALDDIPERSAAVVLLLAVPALIAWFNREPIKELYEKRRSLLTFHFLAAGALVLSYLVLEMPVATQYKFLIFGEICLGLLLAAPLRGLFHKRYILALLILLFFAVPISTKLAPRLFFGWPVTIQASENSISIDPMNAEEHELYAWIKNNTSPQAMFVDTRLEVPVFARRSLFVGLDPPVPQSKPDGWFIPPSLFFKEIIGIGSDVAERRRILAEQLLDESELPLDGLVIDQLRNEAGDRSLYIIARDGRVRAKLSAMEPFAVMMENDAATLLRLTDG